MSKFTPDQISAIMQAVLAKPARESKEMSAVIDKLTGAEAQEQEAEDED